MYFACKFSKQGDSLQPCCTPFPGFEPVFPYLVLTVASLYPAYRFLKRGILISLKFFRSLLWSTAKAFPFVTIRISRFWKLLPIERDSADNSHGRQPLWKSVSKDCRVRDKAWSRVLTEWKYRRGTGWMKVAGISIRSSWLAKERGT